MFRLLLCGLGVAQIAKGVSSERRRMSAVTSRKIKDLNSKVGVSNPRITACLDLKKSCKSPKPENLAHFPRLKL